jgi:hypothetical protein
MCLSLVACSTSSSKASINTLATVAPPPTSNNVAIANAPTTGPGTVTTFEYSAFIDSVDLAAHTITIDPMSFLTGAAAISAFKQANPSAKEGPPNDYYIVNPTKDHDVLPLSPTAVVRLVDVDGGPHTNPVKVAQTKLVGYRWYDARRLAPRFCFGHGLSYTTFTLGRPQISATELRAAQLDHERVRVVVPVHNTGTRRGAEVVQCYVHDMRSSVARPPQELKAFAKIWLDAGATAEAILELDRRAFAFWDVDADDWVVEPGEFEIRIGTSSRAIAHRAVITVIED